MSFSFMQTRSSQRIAILPYLYYLRFVPYEVIPLLRGERSIMPIHSTSTSELPSPSIQIYRNEELHKQCYWLYRRLLIAMLPRSISVDCRLLVIM